MITSSNLNSKSPFLSGPISNLEFFLELFEFGLSFLFQIILCREAVHRQPERTFKAKGIVGDKPISYNRFRTVIETSRN